MKDNFSRNFVKHSLVATLALGGIGVAQAGTATDNLSVSATVTANCTITATSALGFGAYDPIVTNASTALNGTGTVSTTCTNGSAAVITLGQGATPAGGSSAAVPLRQMSDGGANRLAYTLFSDTDRSGVGGNTAGTGVGTTGNGTARSLTVYGSVASSQNVPAGSYTDTVIATVTF